MLAALLAATLPAVTFAVSDKAMAAFKAGRYEQAVKLLTPEAEAGDAEAQYYLATTLRFLLPRPKSEVRANPSETDPKQQEIHRWFEKAALFADLKGKPSNVAVKQSSGFAELDQVAVKFASATTFRTNCTNVPHPLTIAVE